MRVLHVIPSIAPQYGGPSQLVIELCQQLSSQGTEVDLLTTNADGRDVLDIKTDTWTDYHGVKTWFLHRSFSESFKYARGAAEWLDDKVASYHVVHIHAVFSHLPVLAGRACSRFQIPYIVRPLGTLDAWSLNQKQVRKRLFLMFSGRKLLENAWCVQYTSELEKKSSEASHSNPNDVVIPNGLRSGQYGPNPDEPVEVLPGMGSAGYVLFMGRLTEKKNIELLIDEFAALNSQETFRGLQLVIAGDGESGYVRSLVERASTHHCSEHIIFTGWVSGVRKRQLLAQARLFVLPSSNENYGIAVAESLASSVPVVVSDQVYLHPEISEGNCGWVWLAGTSLAEVIGSALDSGECERRGQNGRKFVDTKIDWKVVSPRITSLYMDCTKTTGQDNAK